LNAPSVDHEPKEGIHGLTLSEIHPDAVTTAYGPLADFITIAQEEAARG